MTSTSVGWVLLDGQGPDAATLDNDAFDVQTDDDAAADDTAQHAAAARGAQAIATASGHKVGAVHLTWTPDVETTATALLKSLADLGFDNVLAIPLSQATQGWGIEVGRLNEHHKSALCILEPDAASVMVVATGAGTVRTAFIDHRETVEDLVESLRTIFRKDGWLPESLHLVGSRTDLDKVADPISDALPIPVFGTVDTQLALARGAALASVGGLEAESVEAAETPRDLPWRVSAPKKLAAFEAEETVATPAVSEGDIGPAPTVKIPRDDPPRRRERPWVVTHAKKLTISAAAIAVVGAALSLAAGSALNVENVSAEAANPPAEGASAPSVSVHTVPAPVSALPAAPVQPLAAPPPAPAPPPPALVPPAPPEPLSRPAEPVASVAPEPVAVPVPHQAVSVAPPAAPLAAPIAPPPAAPPAAPAPAEVPAPAAAPALVAPAPLAPPPAPVPAPEEPLPPDPVQAALSPLFSGLP